MEKIIITGTKGFIGGNLLAKLKDKFDILEINENIFQSEDWIDALNFILNKFKPNSIFHIGACANTLESDVNYMMKVNYEFTKILSDYCFSTNTKLIYSSSAANYGTNGLYPSNLYGWSKYIAENYVLKNNGIALRYFNVYGFGEQNKDNMASVAYQMFVKNKKNEDIKLFPLKPKRDFVYIDDVIDANIFANDNYNSLCGSYYEVSSGESRLFEDVMDIIGIEYSYTHKDVIPKGYQFLTQSNQKKWMPNWHPKYNLENGLKRYFEKLNQFFEP